MVIILGLEAFNVRVQWEPAQNHDLGQAIEATYQLISTPISLNLKLTLNRIRYSTGVYWCDLAWVLVEDHSHIV